MTQQDTDRCDAPNCQGPKRCEAPGCEALHANGCSGDSTARGWRCPRHAGALGRTVAYLRQQIEELIEKNREAMTIASESGNPIPSLAGFLNRGEFSYAPSGREYLRDLSQILLSSGDPLDIEELTAWRVAELRQRDEMARFEIIGIFRDDRPVQPQSLLIVREDGRFENPERPGT